MLKDRSDLIIRPIFFLNVLQSIVTDDVGAHIPNKKFIVVLKMDITWRINLKKECGYNLGVV